MKLFFILLVISFNALAERDCAREIYILDVAMVFASEMGLTIEMNSDLPEDFNDLCKDINNRAA